MSETKKKSKRPLGTLLVFALIVFYLSPFGSNLIREGFLSFKNGNIVGQEAPAVQDGVEVAAQRSTLEASGEGELDAAAGGWVLWSFFSPT